MKNDDDKEKARRAEILAAGQRSIRLLEKLRLEDFEIEIWGWVKPSKEVPS